MTPEDFKTTRKELGLSQKEMGRALGFIGDEPDRQVRRLEAGTRNTTGPVLKVLDYIEKYGVLT